MKNLVKNSLVVVALFTTLMSNADSLFKTTYDDEKRTTLTLKNVKRGNQLLIKDDYGIVLYKEMIESNGNYTKGFNLTELPDGNYFFELDKGLEIRTIPFSVITNTVKFDKEKETVIFKPFIKSTENMLYVSKLSLYKQPLEVNIYYDITDGKGLYELIYSDTISNTQTIKRVYNLDKKEKGKYKVVTKTEGKTFIDYVQI